MNRLLTNFLNFAKPRDPEFAKVPVEQMLDSVVTLAEHASRRKQIAFRKEIAGDLTELECDSEQLTQILLNLTINAMQAMPYGGEIVLSAHRQDGNAVIQVRDQGTGISEDNLEKIFDPFFTTKESGTGLGLPVAHQIAVRQGGILTAMRNADRGMTFSLEIPLSTERVTI